MLADSWARLAETLLKILDRFGGLFAAFKAGQGTEKLKQAEEDRDQKSNDAQAWADAPDDYSDFDRRLHELAARKRKNNS